METRVKERLTGALILVALLVIVVPEMLSGPGPDTDTAAPADADGPPLRSYTMDLGGTQADQSALAPRTTNASPPAVAAPAAPAQPTSATPAPAANTAPTPATQPAPGPAASAPPAAPPAVASPPSRTAATASAPAPRPAPAAAGSNAWWVQVGSFSQSANAERVVKQLATSGITARISSTRSNGKELFRVRAGPVADRAAAEQLRQRVAAAGHKGTLVAP